MLGDSEYVACRGRLPDVPDAPEAELIAVLRTNARQLAIYRDVVENGMTYRGIGKEMGITPQRVYEVVQKVATKIRIHGHKLERGE